MVQLGILLQNDYGVITLASNDVFLLDGIIEDYADIIEPNKEKQTSKIIGRAFETFAVEQVMKEYDFSKQELDYGVVDGKDDGGIDEIFLVVNGHLVFDIESFIWPKSCAYFEIIIISCKHHETFEQIPIDKLIASVSELLDFQRKEVNLNGVYNKRVLKNRRDILTIYKKVASVLTDFRIQVYYLSRGDVSLVAENVQARANQLVAICSEYFSSCKASFAFVGGEELLELYRKKPTYSLELTFKEWLSLGKQYVVLVSLKDYYTFLCDEDGKLRKYIFNSNVRDYMGLNPVNKDIMTTLSMDNSPDFWWLNNGVTIISSKITITGEMLHIENVQIVNGLQTSESIYRYFSDGELDEQDRHVLVRIIETSNENVRDEIIRSTNNQTAVLTASLHATDKIQKDIEDVLFRQGLYYGRKTNYHENQGVPANQVISPLYLASGYVALILKNIQKAKTLKNKFMRNEQQYNLIFSDSTPLEVWPQLASVYRKVDECLENERPSATSTSRFLKNNRHLLAFITVSRLFGSFNFGMTKLISLDMNTINQPLIVDTWNSIKDIRRSPPPAKVKWEGPSGDQLIIAKLSQVYSINDLQSILKRRDILGSSATNSIEISKSFLDQVDALLPEQPWEPYVHKDIATALGCTNSKAYQAIDMLIRQGIRKKQKDGKIV